MSWLEHAFVITLSLASAAVAWFLVDRVREWRGVHRALLREYADAHGLAFSGKSAGGQLNGRFVMIFIDAGERASVMHIALTSTTPADETGAAIAPTPKISKPDRFLAEKMQAMQDRGWQVQAFDRHSATVHALVANVPELDAAVCALEDLVDALERSEV